MTRPAGSSGRAPGVAALARPRSASLLVAAARGPGGRPARRATRTSRSGGRSSARARGRTGCSSRPTRARDGPGGRLQSRLARGQPRRLRRLDRAPGPQGADRDLPALPARLVDPPGRLPAQRPGRRPRRARRPGDLAVPRPARPEPVRADRPLGRRQPRGADGGGGGRGRPPRAQGRGRDHPRRGLPLAPARPRQRPRRDPPGRPRRPEGPGRRRPAAPARSSPRPRRSRSTARSSSSTGADLRGHPQFRADHLAPTGGLARFDTGDGSSPPPR